MLSVMIITYFCLVVRRPLPNSLHLLVIRVGMVSYKNLLQEHMQKQGLSLPHYETERVEEGFKSTVRVHRPGNADSEEFTSSPQPVKKAAEQEAAKAACLKLNLIQ